MIRYITTLIVFLMIISSCNNSGTVESDKIRYWLVAYKATGDDNGYTGNLWFAGPCFPSNSFIKKSASEGHGFSEENVIVTNIVEFKSEQDFLDFTTESE